MSSMDKEIKNSDTNSGNVDQEEEQIKPNEVQLMGVSPNFEPVKSNVRCCFTKSRHCF